MEHEFKSGVTMEEGKWYDWDGNGNPVFPPSTIVSVKFRNGDIQHGAKAAQWFWDHSKLEGERDTDIVGVMLAGEAERAQSEAILAEFTAIYDGAIEELEAVINKWHAKTGDGSLSEYAALMPSILIAGNMPGSSEIKLLGIQGDDDHMKQLIKQVYHNKCMPAGLESVIESLIAGGKDDEQER